MKITDSGRVNGQTECLPNSDETEPLFTYPKIIVNTKKSFWYKSKQSQYNTIGELHTNETVCHKDKKSTPKG